MHDGGSEEDEDEDLLGLSVRRSSANNQNQRASEGGGRLSVPSTAQRKPSIDHYRCVLFLAHNPAHSSVPTLHATCAQHALTGVYTIKLRVPGFCGMGSDL